MSIIPTSKDEKLEQKLQGLKPGDHLCCIYQTEEEHRALLRPFMTQGLDRAEKVVYIVDARTAEDVLGYLQEEGIQVERYLSTGQLRILTTAEAYTREAVFDPDGMICLLEGETQRALAEGYSALRVTGEMTWALRGSPGSDRLVEYEAKLNEFFPRHRCLAICQYDKRRFEPGLLLDVLTTHPLAVIGTKLFDNFYFMHPKDLLGPDPEAARLSNWLHSLELRRQAEEAMRDSEERFRSIYWQSPVGIELYDCRGKLIDVNPAGLDIFGVEDVEQIRGFDLFGDPNLPAEAKERLEHGRPAAYETCFDFELVRQKNLYKTFKSGRCFMDYLITPLEGSLESPGGFLVHVRDINQRKEAEEALRKTHHELESRVRERTEELTKANQRLREAELKYRTVSDFAYDWAYWVEPEGRFRYIAPSCERITGYRPQEFQGNPSLLHDIVVPEDRPVWEEHHRESHKRKKPAQLQFRIRRRDGQVVWLEHVCRPVLDEQGKYLGIRASNRDITDRKQAESERNITVQLLSQASAAGSLHELLSGITSRLQRWSGCEAIGIRLREGDDYPYYETRGFSSEFVLAENRLCAVDAQGRPLRDHTGNPILECMCGNILCGRFDPKLPFFTERGSFWTNGTSELLASTTEAERQSRTRNRCNGEGYESVALIPLRAAGETFGLLQFNDRRKGMFSALRIGLFERLAYSIASAVARQKAVEALRASEEKLRQQQRSLAEAQRIAHLGSWEWNVVTNELFWSDEAYRIFGLRPQEFGATYDAFLASVHPEDRDSVEEAVNRALVDPDTRYSIEHRVVRPDGSQRVVHERGHVTFEQPGRAARMIGTVQDITERKQAEVKLRDALEEVERLKDRLRAENIYLQEEIKGSYDFDEIVGRSDPLKLTLRKIEHVAGTDANVLLLGETGTGKELFARAVHSRSPRKDRPLVKVNCAALPSTLIESELFGHVKGAFTGALSDKLGRFQLADGGTIFLDEIGELDPELQTKLLHVLQEGEFERIGSPQTVQVDVRIIAATNRDPQKAMREGSFRPDLYYRLAVFPVEVPPLRVRRDDIPLLAWHFITKARGRLGKNIRSIPSPVMDALVEYDWPGNVRELENVIERAMILSTSSTLALDESFANPAQTRRSEGPSCNLEDIDRAHIVGVLEECHWKIKGASNAADRLGLKPSTLRYRMKKLGIRRPPRRPR